MTQVRVPAVAGRATEAALLILIEAKLRGVATSATSATVAKGIVIDQNPLAGRQVEAESTVELVVSTGRAEVAVPAVVGRTTEAALLTLFEADLRGVATSASSETVAKGIVIEQNPLAGRQVEAGSTVGLVVSTGRTEVAVPAVVGRTREAALLTLFEADLRGVATSATSATVAKDVVVEQSPRPGTMVEAGSTVELVVSTGRTEVAVPAVVGRTREAALLNLMEADLRGVVTSASSATVAIGIVIEQNPLAGRQVEAESTVELVVSTGPA